VVLSRSGTPAELRRAWLDGAYELIVPPALLNELGRLLSYPKIAKRVNSTEARELLDVLRRYAELADDPDDDYLICLAETASAVIVSGDSDLPSLADQIPVYSPAAFRTQLAQA